MQRLADRVTAVFVQVVIAPAVGILGYWLGRRRGWMPPAWRSVFKALTTTRRRPLYWSSVTA